MVLIVHPDLEKLITTVVTDEEEVYAKVSSETLPQTKHHHLQGSLHSDLRLHYCVGWIVYTAHR